MLATSEDLKTINALKEEILCRACQMTLENLDATSKGRFSKLFVSADCGDMEERKTCEKYTFFTGNEVNIALYLFFSNEYNAKRIARSCYMLDEDDKFNESMDTEIPLGKIVLPNGGILTSTIVEAVLKVRPFDSRNFITGMPFDIMTFRLIKSE